MTIRRFIAVNSKINKYEAIIFTFINLFFSILNKLI